MNKLIYGIALTLVLGTTGALAGGNGGRDDDDGGSNAAASQLQGQLQGQGQKQGQAQGQGQQQGQEATGVGVGVGIGKGGNSDATAIGVNKNANLNANLNSNRANSESNAQSTSNSGAVGVGVGGSARNDVDVTTGPAISGSISAAKGGEGGAGGRSKSSSVSQGGSAHSGSYSSGGDSYVGDTTASVGNTSSVSAGGSSAVGDTTTGDNNVSVDASDNSSYSYEENYPVSTAASLFTQVCQTGGSGQGEEFGFSIINPDSFCQHLQLADVARNAYMWEMEYGLAKCADAMGNEWAQEGYSDHCVNERALEYYEDMHQHIESAMSLVETTEEVAWVDRVAGFMARPIAVIGALIWLL